MGQSGGLGSAKLIKRLKKLWVIVYLDLDSKESMVPKWKMKSILQAIKWEVKLSCCKKENQKHSSKQGFMLLLGDSSFCYEEEH